MVWFLKSKEESSVSKLHNFLTLAFGKVKQDTTNIFSWLNYFNQKHQEHDARLDEIERALYYLPKTPQEIKQIVDSFYSFDGIQNKVNQISARLDALEGSKGVARATTTVTHPHAQSLREKLVQRIARNSKDYVKSVILSMIKRYQKISGSQLRDIIVEEQGLCSKSSFYRLLEEIEKEEDIAFISQGREKLYLAKAEVMK